MPISLAGAFTTVWLPSAGTLTDVSAYAAGLPEIDLGSDDTDVTTFIAGGGSIAETHIQGAIVSSLRIPFLYDLVIAKILRQLVGSRVGFTVQVRSGANAAPSFGDEIVTGAFTLLSLAVPYQPGQVCRLDCNFVPVDQGAIVPVYGVI